MSHKLSGLTSETYCLTVLEATNPSVSRAGSFWGLWERICYMLSLSFQWFVGNLLHSLVLLSPYLCFHLSCSVLMYVACVFKFFVIRTPVRLGPTLPLWPHPAFKQFWYTKGYDQRMNFGKDTIQPLTVLLRKLN